PRRHPHVTEERMSRLARALLLTASLALLAACAGYELEKSPAFYESLARPGAQVNVAAAASMLSDYRRANGLPAVAADTALTELARTQARRMAEIDKLTHDPG